MKKIIGIFILVCGFLVCGVFANAETFIEGNFINGEYVNKVKNNKAKFQVTYLGRNASPLYETNVITAKIKNKTVSFKWKDTWGNSGTGKLRLYNGYVKIKMKQTKTAEWNRSTLDTQGKYIKINKCERRRLRSTVEKELREVNPQLGHVCKFSFF